MAAAARESISQQPPLLALAGLVALPTGETAAADDEGDGDLCKFGLFGLLLEEGDGDGDAAATDLLRMSSTLVFSLLISGISPSLYLRIEQLVTK